MAHESQINRNSLLTSQVFYRLIPALLLAWSKDYFSSQKLILIFILSYEILRFVHIHFVLRYSLFFRILTWRCFINVDFMSRSRCRVNLQKRSHPMLLLRMKKSNKDVHKIHKLFLTCKKRLFLNNCS